jgi:DNA repair protein RadC
MRTKADKAREYAALIETCAAYVAEAKPICREPEAVYKVLAPLMAGELQEGFWVVLLNCKNKMISAPVRVTLGLLNSSQVHPRETFRPAIIAGANAVVLAHNHPSGDPTPSAEDITITKRLVESGRILGIQVIDHIIIGVSENPTCSPYCSLRERGLVNFNA